MADLVTLCRMKGLRVWKVESGAQGTVYSLSLRPPLFASGRSLVNPRGLEFFAGTSLNGIRPPLKHVDSAFLELPYERLLVRHSRPPAPPHCLPLLTTPPFGVNSRLQLTTSSAKSPKRKKSKRLRSKGRR